MGDVHTISEFHDNLGSTFDLGNLCQLYMCSDFFHLFGNSTHTGSIGKNCIVFPPIGKNSAFKLI